MHISVRAPEKACAGRQRIRPEELASSSSAVMNMTGFRRMEMAVMPGVLPPSFLHPPTSFYQEA